MESKHPPKTNCHIRISGKIKIHLKTICCNAKPCCKHGSIPRCHGTHRIPQHTNIVCKQYLLPETAHKLHHAGCKQVAVFLPRIKLLCNRFVLYNRTGNQLREQSHIRPERNNIALHLRLPAVNVHRVGHCLECVKGNSDRKCQMKQRNFTAKQGIHIPNQKIRIFKKSQKRKINNHGLNHKISGSCPVPLF